MEDEEKYEGIQESCDDEEIQRNKWPPKKWARVSDVRETEANEQNEDDDADVSENGQDNLGKTTDLFQRV